MTNPNICGRCDSMNRSCCTLRAENNAGSPAPVSFPEINRIFTVLKNKKTDDLLEKKINTPMFFEQMTGLFPDMATVIEKVFPAGSIHFELKTKDDTCIFKQDDGCLLPSEARPLFCRIYPFWFFGEEPHLFQDTNCLALENCDTIAEVLLAFGTNIEKLKQLHHQLCIDWGFYRSIPQKKTRIFR